jgi:hypothetical protein
MTKIEKDKCRKLMEEAIRKANNSKIRYEEYEALKKEGKQVECKTKYLQSTEDYGYALGIQQSLAVLGFKHDRMKELNVLL